MANANINISPVSKTEAREKLIKEGYKVIDDNSVVTVLLDEKQSMKSAIKDIREKLSVWGYQSSFGIRYHKGEDPAEEEAGEEEAATLQEEASMDAGNSEHPLADITEEEYLDEEDESEAEDLQDSVIIDEDDMDMLMNGDNIQFSLEDFGVDF